MKYPIISTRDLSLLPDVETLMRITQSMSVIYEILTSQYDCVIPEVYYHQGKWPEDCKAAHMDNQQGDLWHMLFNAHGAVMLGFFHEAEMSPWGPHCGEIWPNMYEGLPSEFMAVFDDPFFEADEAVTFCIWRKHTDSSWQRGPVKFPFRKGDKTGLSYFNEETDAIVDYLDGSAEALSRLDGNPRRFWEWMKDSFSDNDVPEEISLELIEAIYAHQPLNQAMVEALNPGLKLDSIREALMETGYPLA